MAESDLEAELRELGLRLQRTRAARGFSRNELLARSGVSTSTIQAIEGGRRDPTFSTLAKLARGLASSHEDSDAALQQLLGGLLR